MTVLALLGPLTEPFSDGITARALAEVALLGVVGGALGTWVVLFGLSYSAESLAHSLFPGLVIAALTGFSVLLGGLGGIVVAALAVALAARVPAVGRDAAVAVVVTTSFGLGVLLALSPDSPPGIQTLLFGDILGVTDLDLVLAAGLAAATLVALWALHGRLLAVGFDRSNASALGASPLLADVALLALLSATIVVAVQALGNLLLVALLVGPAAAARLLARRVWPMMALAVVLAVIGGAGGVYLSYYAETAAGASIALVVVALYAAIAAASGARLLAGGEGR
jgi:ABC-type Mn2+/Zn2+ transport system permease subunit